MATKKSDPEGVVSKWAAWVGNALLAILTGIAGFGIPWAREIDRTTGQISVHLSNIQGQINEAKTDVESNQNALRKHDEKVGHDVMVERFSLNQERVEEDLDEVKKDVEEVKSDLKRVDQTTQEILRRLPE